MTQHPDPVVDPIANPAIDPAVVVPPRSLQGLLDSRQKISELDPMNILGSIEALPDQIEHTWSLRSTITNLENIQGFEPKQIVVAGMGGSALGAQVIKSLYAQELLSPIEIVNQYELPGYVDSQTLVVLSSYSGTTEETLSAAQDAKARGAKVAVICSGGRLQELAEENAWSLFLIVPTHNPSNQPRMAIGYAVFAMLALFSEMKLLDISDAQVTSVIHMLRQTAKGLSPDQVEGNVAKTLAYASVDRQLLLLSAEHLRGAVHVVNNQLNENAKNFTIEHHLPELNHHLMEGLQFPSQMHESTLAILFHSSFYHARVSARFPLTQDVIEQNHIGTQTVQVIGDTPLHQVWEVIQLGSYLNFYLAMLNGINPAPIPWVDYFKSHLPKQ